MGEKREVHQMQDMPPVKEQESGVKQHGDVVKSQGNGIRKKTSLRRGFLVIVTLCWMIPVLLISLVLGMKYQSSMSGKIDNLMQDELKNFMVLTRSQIEECITISKKLSYDGTIENVWWNRQEGKVSENEFYRVVMGELRNQFYNDKRFRMAAFFLTEEPETVYYVSGEKTNYWEWLGGAMPREAVEFSREDDSYAHLLVLDEKLYLLRNLYSISGYTKFGTLVLELDQEKLFSGVTRSDQTEIVLFMNEDWNQRLYADSMTDRDKQACESICSMFDFEGKDRTLRSGERGAYQYWFYQIQESEYEVAAAMLVDARKAYSEIRAMRLLLGLLFVVLLPVLGLMLGLTYRHISKPVRKLADGFQSLENGNFGEHLTVGWMPNAEFQELAGSFNKMSDELSYLFDTMYKEKLARKDAAIIALQSQINPHFLNNTLEMMNWQARMAGDNVVSKMIGELGTLLDYSMDRSNRKMISVAEEMRCADAYFYIISMRFGQRLQVEKECDSELLKCEVPRLILQPLLENAVFHGVEKRKQGKITLRIYREESDLILKVTNTGFPLSGEEKEKIQRILSGSALDPSEGRVSIGVRNVNERIRLIYGERYGLSIYSEADGQTSSKVRIPLNSEKTDDENSGEGAEE